MINDVENPFSVTKATEFSDSEINDQWVNFNTQDEKSVISLLNPTEYLPKYVIGGKGCGKTHILRYFSFPLQKIRYKDNIKEILIKDKYIGLYSILGGINSSRFSGKGIDEEAWCAVFEYFFELYICDNLLQTIGEISQKLDIGTKEEAVVREIVSQFSNTDGIDPVSSYQDLIELLATFRKKIEDQILNAAFTRKLDYDDVKIRFSPGDLLFGIPNILSTTYDEFKDVKIIFILDEYEKLFEWQKKFINSLVWDKKTPVTFWIGARRYGYTTRNTKSGELMKNGSEFQEVNLDFIIRENEGLYKEFARQLYIKRLSKYYLSKGVAIPDADVNAGFCGRFENFDEGIILKQVIDKGKKGYKHLKNLKNKITSAVDLGKSFEIKTSGEVDALIEKIIADTNNDPLEQKYKIFLFYQKWYQAKSNDTFGKIVKYINAEYSKYLKGKDSDFDDIKEKRKKDLLAQLTKEYRIKNIEHSGVDKFIELSEGNARTFILILKKTIEYSKIKGERPLEENGSISLDSQYMAIHDTARWFYEDAEVQGDNGKHMYNSLKRLSDYFVLHRFCDKPTETTVSCFDIKTEELSGNASTCAELMNVHSMIIEIESGRVERNSGRKEKLFRLNKVLAPLWNLPSVVRGTLHFNKEVADAIFGEESNVRFEKLYKKREAELNAPFLKHPSNNDQNLFDSHEN
jgi:hypothetical protein